MIAGLRAVLVIVIVFVVTLVLLPVQLLAMRLGHPWRQSLPRLWHRIVLPLMGLRVHVYGQPLADGPLLLVSNHVSWSDIVVLGSLADVVFIAKAEMRDWPVFGVLARLQRSVFIKRERRGTTKSQIDDVAQRLACGETVVLFAEGTTSDGNRVLPFKSSLIGAASVAVEAATDTVVRIQPVAIAYVRANGVPLGRHHRPIAAWPGDTELAPHLWDLLCEGAIDVEVCFGAPIPHTGKYDRKALSLRLERDVRYMNTMMLRGRAVSDEPA